MPRLPFADGATTPSGGAIHRRRPVHRHRERWERERAGRSDPCRAPRTPMVAGQACASRAFDRFRIASVSSGTTVAAPGHHRSNTVCYQPASDGALIRRTDMWDPDVYLAFADHRGRPFYDLLSRVGAERARRVVDLGCGPGHLTQYLGRRWPDAVIEAVDSSPEMVAAAKERGIDAVTGDLRDWKPKPDTDV